MPSPPASGRARQFVRAASGSWPTLPIPVKRYEQLAKQFNPNQFNAEQWVQYAPGLPG